MLMWRTSIPRTSSAGERGCFSFKTSAGSNIRINRRTSKVQSSFKFDVFEAQKYRTQ